MSTPFVPIEEFLDDLLQRAQLAGPGAWMHVTREESKRLETLLRPEIKYVMTQTKYASIDMAIWVIEARRNIKAAVIAKLTS